MAEPLVIAHLTDTHVGQPAAERRLRAVLDHVSAMQPPVDVVLITGDLVNDGTAAEYETLRAVLADWPGPAPVLLLPGNHDDHDRYAVLRGLPTGADSPLDEAHEVAGVGVLMLDTLIPPREGERRIDAGHLREASLRWLDERLAARPAGERTVVCLHHPPVEVGISLMDPIMLDNADALTDVLGRHDGVVALLTGHAHTMFAGELAGIPVRVGGAVASSTSLDAEPLPRITPDLPPTFALHLLGADGSVRTHWRALPLP